MECVSELENEISSNEFAAYLVVATAALLVIVYIIINVMGDFIMFTEGLGLPGQSAFIIGTMLSFVVLTYVVYHANKETPSAGIIFMYVLFFILYFIWCLNFSVAAEFYNRGAKVRTHAGFYLSGSILCLLFILYWSSLVSFGVSMLTIVPIGWCVYLLYKWWFRFHPKGPIKLSTKSCDNK